MARTGAFAQENRRFENEGYSVILKMSQNWMRREKKDFTFAFVTQVQVIEKKEEETSKIYILI
ncbi:UNVERIFIED_CONTAM: hypothetical protein NCL1_24343 [Trichonephila clavipes]